MAPNNTPTPEKNADVIILIMGMTGSGKSSFIKNITGDERCKIGHDVSSETFEIGVYYWSAPDGRRVALVDTPGFDDSNGLSDSEVLDEIASYLKGNYGKINGLIYCQRIDVRAGALTISNLKMFEKVCGLALKNAALVTTRWDVVGDERAVNLEQQLVTGEKYFAPLCRAGAVAFGYNNTAASAVRVMYKLLNNNPIVLQIQEELAKPGATLGHTAAGSQLNTNFDAMIQKQEKEMRRLREDMAEAIKARDKDWQKDLDDQLAKRKELVERSEVGKEQLKKPPSKRGMFERVMSAGAEGARQSGLIGMLGGLGGAALGEGYRFTKVAAAPLTGKTMKEANQQYQRDFDHVMAKSAATSNQGRNKATRALGGPVGFWSGGYDVITGKVGKGDK